MKRTLITLAIASLITAGMGTAFACEYKKGETKFADYANCRYGEDSIVVVDLPETVAWEKCIYQVQAFRPANLLAVTREKNGKEEASINQRGDIGNPCYLTKQHCDKALKAWQDG
jgi:hypothetical protein